MLRRRLVAWSDLTERDVELWRSLLERTNAAPDLSRDWGHALITAHRIPVDEVAVLYIEDASTVRAIIPLHRRSERRFGLTIHRVQPLAGVFSLHLDLLSDLDIEATAAQLLDFLDRHEQGWSVLRLNGLVAGGSLANALLEQARTRRSSVEEELGASPPFLEIHSDWQTYLKGKSGNFRSNLKRKARKIREAGDVRIEFITELEGVTAALRDIQLIERNSWKASAGTAITSREWEEQFYAALAERFGRCGQLLVTLVTLDGKPLAHDLTILGGGRAWCLKTSFDGAYAELSPGMVLRAELMQRLFESGIREYDFLGNNERYKLEWTDTVRRSLSLTMFNRRNAAGVVLALRNRVRRARGSATG